MIGVDIDGGGAVLSLDNPPVSVITAKVRGARPAPLLEEFVRSGRSVASWDRVR